MLIGNFKEMKMASISGEIHNDITLLFLIASFYRKGTHDDNYNTIMGFSCPMKCLNCINIA